MQHIDNTIQNNILAAFGKRAPQGVLKAIEKASTKTGVNFAYMVQQAAAESNFNAKAKARTSSATGLYQFIDSTWLNTVEKHGYKHGISVEGKSRHQILEMRKDPQIAANMAAEFASDNQKFLEDNWAKGEKEIGSTELYLAHFLGAGGAAAFLNARDQNPHQTAAYVFPKEAAANRNVFYDSKTGKARSLDQIHAFFDKKFEIKGGENVAAQTYAANSTTRQPHVRHQPVSSEALLAFESGTRVQHQASVNVMQASSELRSIYGFTRSYSPAPYHALINAPIEIMVLSELDTPIYSKDGKSKSLFSNA